MESIVPQHRLTRSRFTNFTMDYIRNLTGIVPSVEYQPLDCIRNCSGHGTCMEGKCVCLIQFVGEACDDINMLYFVAFAAIFFTLCAVCVVQLFLCIRSEYLKEEKGSMRRALDVTAQKLLYMLVICASAIRGAYFIAKSKSEDHLAEHLLSAYYPFIITGLSLLTCFWAEVFYLDGIALEKPRMLTKSMIAFIAFTIFNYTLLCAQVLVSEFVGDVETKETMDLACNTIFAVLMIVVVTMFLTYGVEVYFKVRGAFIKASYNVDFWQLHMSRLGLTAQAGLQLIAALCLLVDVYKEVWKDKLPLFTQNLYEICYRVVEFGVALWFSCVLWNSSHPEKLWVLNPRRLFRTIHLNQLESNLKTETDQIDVTGRPRYGSFSDSKLECWICFDSERTDSGPLIKPCACKGDVSAVHHECLKTWLIQSSNTPDNLKCRVCNTMYKMEPDGGFFMRGKPVHWLQTFTIIITIVGCPLGLYVLWNSLSQTYQHILAMGITILIEVTLFRLLGANLTDLWKKARIASMKILGASVSVTKTDNKNEVSVSTIATL